VREGRGPGPRRQVGEELQVERLGLRDRHHEHRAAGDGAKPGGGQRQHPVPHGGDQARLGRGGEAPGHAADRVGRIRGVPTDHAERPPPRHGAPSVRARAVVALVAQMREQVGQAVGGTAAAHEVGEHRRPWCGFRVGSGLPDSRAAVQEIADPDHRCGPRTAR
jgi:hypothetical protein